MDRYQNTKGLNSINNTKYPDIPYSFEDTYVITTEGDRFDILAQQYYNNSSYWWIISIANPQLNQNSMIPPIGEQIRIPSNIGGIINQFEQLNSF